MEGLVPKGNKYHFVFFLKGDQNLKKNNLIRACPAYTLKHSETVYLMTLPEYAISFIPLSPHMM